MNTNKDYFATRQSHPSPLFSIRFRMLRKSTDDIMDVAMTPAGKAVEGDDEESSAAATSPPPIKEVNNNVLGSACMGAEVAASPEASTASTELAKAEAAAATVYSCGSLRVSVTAAVTPSAAAQWLCVARLPRDFTRAELLELVEEYGAVEETHMIHSEKTGKQI